MLTHRGGYPVRILHSPSNSNSYTSIPGACTTFSQRSQTYRRLLGPNGKTRTPIALDLSSFRKLHVYILRVESGNDSWLFRFYVCLIFAFIRVRPRNIRTNPFRFTSKNVSYFDILFSHFVICFDISILFRILILIISSCTINYSPMKKPVKNERSCVCDHY